MKAGIVSLVIDRDIALIIANSPPVNTIDAAVRKELGERLAELEARKDIRAAVLLCEGSTFFSGADMGEFSGPPKEEEYRALFNRLEALPFPVVAAMHGTVMGGGLEIALACHYRVAAPKTRFAFPEVTLGIIPGAGGTQRMPRLIGIEATLAMVLDASPVDAARAIELGFVDAIVQGDLRAAAVAYAASLTAGAAHRRQAGRAGRPEDHRAVSASRPESATRTGKPRWSPLTAIEASATRPFAQGLRYETELVNQAKATVESKALVHVFFAERETRKIPGIGPEVQPRPVTGRRHRRRGHDGRRHRHLLCERGHSGDADRHQRREPGARAGGGGSHLRVDGQARPPDRGRQGQAPGADPRHARLRRSAATPTSSSRRCSRTCDLKKKIFAALDRVAKPGAILATNTSTLDIDEIATRRQAAAGRGRPAFLFAGQRDAAAGGGAHRQRRPRT